MKANSKQISGKHYQSSIQCWDYIVANDIGYLAGNVIKYLTRYKKKNGMVDLEKAEHYMQKLMEVERNNERLIKAKARTKHDPANYEASHDKRSARISQRLVRAGNGRRKTQPSRKANDRH